MRDSVLEEDRKEEKRIENIKVTLEQFKASQEDELKELGIVNGNIKYLEDQVFELQSKLLGYTEKKKILEKSIILNSEDFNGFNFEDEAQILLDEV